MTNSLGEGRDQEVFLLYKEIGEPTANRTDRINGINDGVLRRWP